MICEGDDGRSDSVSSVVRNDVRLPILQVGNGETFVTNRAVRKLQNKSISPGMKLPTAKHRLADVQYL